jgi:hypothetical protein
VCAAAGLSSRAAVEAPAAEGDGPAAIAWGDRADAAVKKELTLTAAVVCADELISRCDVSRGLMVCFFVTMTAALRRAGSQLRYCIGISA